MITKMLRPTVSCLLLATLVVATSSASGAIWTGANVGDGPGPAANNWSVGANWDTGTPPGTGDTIANFTATAWSGANTPTITLDQNVILGTILFGSSPAAFAKTRIAPDASPTETITLNSGTGISTITVENSLREAAIISVVMTGTDTVRVNVGSFASAPTNNNFGLSLRAQNTYSGRTEVQTGLLTLGVGSVGSPGALTSGPAGTGTISLVDGTALATTSNLTIGNAVELSGGVEFGGYNANMIMTGATTLVGSAAVTQFNGQAPFNQVRFQGDIGESVPGTDLTLAAGGTVPDGGDRWIYLDGDNTFTGGLTVTKGRVVIDGDNSAMTGDVTVIPTFGDSLIQVQDDNAFASSSTLFLTSGASDVALILDSGIEATVDSLFIFGDQQIAGTWGSTLSLADNTNDFLFGGTGILNVTNGPTDVPEPSTGLLLAMATVLGFGLRRRRR